MKNIGGYVVLLYTPRAEMISRGERQAILAFGEGHNHEHVRILYNIMLLNGKIQ